ncbi:hypothetical protein BOX15_Mlig026766g1 [Macrostomum lignano]|uniref:Major facilitator superfamily (MFS) profile domain-containing protein n=1 Tax=Macrostomum lignano TaxID=282301 RepID=A0A267E925_9PLAT|nr:hypothetical protein BOX15_Mlig026766g1 [Macrostomum lignano]
MSEVSHLTDQLSKASWSYRWSVTVLLSYVTMKAAFDIFILNLATANVPFHCAQAVIDNQTTEWGSVNISELADTANFSILDYKCFAPQFAREDNGRLAPIQVINDSSASNRPCTAWTYWPTEPGRRNMLMEYDFVCDRAYLADRMQTIMQAGIFVSCCFAPLADAFGRRLPFILFAYIDLTSTILVIFVRDLTAQMVLRFFMGFGSPAVLTGVAYLTELISEDYHGLHGNFYWILWVVGYTTSGVIAYLVMEWRLQMVLVAAIIATGYLSYPWSLIDSPKWLFASGHQSAAKDSLLRLFRRHGLDTATVETMKVDEESTELKGESETLQSSQANAELDSDSKKRRRQQPSNFELVRRQLSRLLPKESLCQSKYLAVEAAFTVLFVANAMSYFSSSFRRDFITKNPYLNVVISGALELPAAFLAWFLTDRCGRRISNMLLLLPAGLLLILVPFVPQPPDVTFGAKSACALLSKFLITVSFCIVLIFGSESLPTNIRATSFILASQVMRLGQTLAPELNGLLLNVNPAFPNFFYGGFCVASGLLLILLPETHNRPMPDSIADMAGLSLPDACLPRARRQLQLQSVELPSRQSPTV